MGCTKYRPSDSKEMIIFSVLFCEDALKFKLGQDRCGLDTDLSRSNSNKRKRNGLSL